MQYANLDEEDSGRGDSSRFWSGSSVSSMKETLSRRGVIQKIIAAVLVAVLVVGLTLVIVFSGGTHAMGANGSSGDAWTKATAVLEQGVTDKVFPGAAALIAWNQRATTNVVYSQSVGRYTYDASSPETSTETSLFDLASLTKVLATTTATAQLYQAGHLGLDDHVDAAHLLGPAFSGQGKNAIRVRHLLLHNAGFPPDPVPGYWQPAFGCPETSKPHPAQNFSCQGQIFDGLMAQTLDHAVGEKYVYSDLSMISMALVVGTVVKNKQLVSVSDLRPGCPYNAAKGGQWCWYEAFVRKNVLEASGVGQHTGFMPSKSVRDQCVPTWNDTEYRHAQVQGQVSDENAFASGGIQGHAGLFATAKDVLAIITHNWWTQHSKHHNPNAYALNSTTISLFTRVANSSQSSRALGWDTNDYAHHSVGGRFCGNFSAATFTHSGYTGTLICADPVSNLVSILLTNRCFPAKTANIHNVGVVRHNFNNQVETIVTTLFNQ